MNRSISNLSARDSSYHLVAFTGAQRDDKAEKEEGLHIEGPKYLGLKRISTKTVKNQT